MEIKDLLGFSKPLTRLIEVISSGCGAVSSPYLIKKTAEARAHEIKVIADALKEVREKNQLPVVYDAGSIEMWQKPEDSTLRLEHTPIAERAMSRLDFQDRKRQDNLEKVTTVAATELNGETTVPDQSPDEDWISRFFTSAQDVSSQEMQQLWGKILAGEIKKPGSYSLRTLDSVRNLTKTEANVFEKLGRLALQFRGHTCIVAAHDKEWLKNERNVLPGEHFLLGELGLMYPTDLAFVAFTTESQREETLVSDDSLLVIKRGSNKSQLKLPMWKFTGVGRELLPLIPKPIDEKYLELVGKFFLNHKCEPIIGKILERSPSGEIQYRPIRKVEAEPQSSPAAQSTPSS